MIDIRGIPLRRWDQVLLTTSLLLVIVLAWLYLFVLADGMAAMEASGMDMSMASMRAWDFTDYWLMFAMWGVMMVGMMVPTALRAVMIYARIARASGDNYVVASTAWFVVGYVAIWTGFSAGATLLQAALENLGLLSMAMVSSSDNLGAGLLIAAGIYQLSPWKDVCLKHCQSPAQYLAGRFGPRTIDGLRLGAGHGGYCLGCCWLLMCLLFVGGVMNLLWIALITGFVLLEKLLPASYGLSRVSAALMIITGMGYVWLSGGPGSAVHS